MVGVAEIAQGGRIGRVADAELGVHGGDLGGDLVVDPFPVEGAEQGGEEVDGRLVGGRRHRCAGQAGQRRTEPPGRHLLEREDVGARLGDLPGHGRRAGREAGGLHGGPHDVGGEEGLLSARRRAMGRMSAPR